MSKILIKFFNQHFVLLIYLFSLFISIYLLFTIRQYGLLPLPLKGMDQFEMITVASDMYRGKMPYAGYLYSPLYTLFVYILIVISQGELIIMRLLQAMLCSLTPVFIYKTARKIRFNRESSQFAALIYCFYGASALISLSFLRAGPLALCYILYVYTFVNAFIKRKINNYIYAGIIAGLCVLGRENFIPVVMAPLLLLFFKDIRYNVKYKFILGYFFAIMFTILPILLYNYIKFNSCSIIPGAFENIFTVFHCKGTERASLGVNLFNSIARNIPVQISKFCSSYEMSNSLSFYAHKDIVQFMIIFIMPFNFLLGLAFIGFFYLKKNKGVLFVALSIVTFCSSMLFFNMFYRYRVPVVPIVALLAGGSFIVFKFKPRRRIVFPVIFILLFCFITYINPNKLRPVNERIAVIKLLIVKKQYVRAGYYIQDLEQNANSTIQLKKLLIKSFNKNCKIKKKIKKNINIRK